jgi:hypothetical protein
LLTTSDHDAHDRAPNDELARVGALSAAMVQAPTARPPAVLSLGLSIATAELERRMRDRLADVSESSPALIVWKRDGLQVAINLESLVVRTLDGWLLCELGLESDQTGAEMLQFVFFLGSKSERPGVQAASTVNAANLAAAQLADAWGDDLQRVMWDAVLDVIEAAVEHAAAANPGAQLTLRAFHCDDNAIGVDLLRGEL